LSASCNSGLMLSDRVPLRRPHPRSLLVRAVIVIRSGWLVIGSGVALTAVLSPSWDTAFHVLGLYYGYTRVVQVFSGWATVRYSGDSRGFTFVRGLVGREERRFSWSSVVSVSVTQHLVQRLFDVADLHITLRASEMSAVTIQDLRTVETARLVRLHAQSGPERSEPHLQHGSEDCPLSRVAAAETDRILTLPLRSRDFVLIGFCTGAFVFFVPSVYSAASEVFAWFGVPTTVLPSVRDIARLDPVAFTLLVAVAAVGSLVYGTAVAWIRYCGFSVTRRSGGELVFTAGLAQREQRVVASDAVSAYEVRRPLLMLPVNRFVLRAVVRGDSGQVTRGLLLPLTRHSHAVEMLRILTGLSSVTLSNQVRPARWLAVVLIITGSGLSIAFVASAAVAPLAVGAVVAAFLLLRAVDVRTGHIRVETSASGVRWVIAQRGVLFRSVWVIRADSVDVCRWAGFSQRRGSHTLTLRGRRTIRLSVWPTSARLALILRREMDSPTPLSFERNPR